jgi:nucleoside-diphosphate-sugar epimerase
MKILITGNMGYVGPAVVRRLRWSCPDATLVGFDMGFFADCLTCGDFFPECCVDIQYYGDVRRFPEEVLEHVDVVVHLAAISNDPMGATFENITLDINHRASLLVAKQAKKAGVKAFIFASSCSVYGFADSGARSEQDSVNPLTAYARSKVLTEQDLAALADGNFVVTSLRFATACGMSDRLRLDLVLNDFVASALACRQITILSDGTPWRPLIHVKDMARAIEWAIGRDSHTGGEFLAVNIGSNGWNYQIKDLAEAVVGAIPGVELSINRNAQPDKRSYQVSFERFRQLAPAFVPQVDLVSAIEDLKAGLEAMGFVDKDFRHSRYIRLNTLKKLKQSGLLTENLDWTHRQRFVEIQR